MSRPIAPAEHAPHAGTWMCWPSTSAIYGGDTPYHEAVQETLGRLAAAIAENEPVHLLAGAAHHGLARRLCGPAVTLVDIPTDDMWARDSGPVFVVDDTGALAAVDFHFNGWGGKQDHGRDHLVAGAIAQRLGVPRLSARVCGEGGGLEVDGEGTLLLTDSCWVNDNRNPGMSRAAIEAELRARLGVEKVVWLPGLAGADITDGHIDGTIRFIRPGVVMLCPFPGAGDDWNRVLEDSRAILARETDARGRAFTLVDIPAATEVRSTRPDFERGYANFYVGNGALYTPQFGDARADGHAVESFARLYPGRRIVALDVDRICENGGGIHCVTQQQPAGTVPP